MGGRAAGVADIVGALPPIGYLERWAVQMKKKTDSGQYLVGTWISYDPWASSVEVRVTMAKGKIKIYHSFWQLPQQRYPRGRDLHRSKKSPANLASRLWFLTTRSRNIFSLMVPAGRPHPGTPARQRYPVLPRTGRRSGHCLLPGNRGTLVQRQDGPAYQALASASRGSAAEWRGLENNPG